jgi:hypothetical protein
MNKILSSLLVLVLCFSMVACSVDQALADINLLITTSAVICTAIGQVSPADSAACGVLASVASSGLAVVKTDYDAYKASGATTDLQKINAAVAAINTNLPAELAAAHISDPVVQQKVTAWVKLITATTTAVLELLPQLQNAPTKTAKMAVLHSAAGTQSLSPEVIKARWASDVCAGEKACAGKVKVQYHGTLTHVATLGLVK